MANTCLFLGRASFKSAHAHCDPSKLVHTLGKKYASHLGLQVYITL